MSIEIQNVWDATSGYMADGMGSTDVLRLTIATAAAIYYAEAGAPALQQLFDEILAACEREEAGRDDH